MRNILVTIFSIEHPSSSRKNASKMLLKCGCVRMAFSKVSLSPASFMQSRELFGSVTESIPMMRCSTSFVRFMNVKAALAELIEDIKSGKVHIIVVYKIDRLTRSLMDFAKLVEIFDQ